MEKVFRKSEFRDTKTHYPEHKTVVEIFEEQATLHTHSIALVHKGESITYGSLNERANRFAHLFRQRGLTVERVAAVMVDQGIDRIAIMLGIMKAGGAFLPIDKSYPETRIKYMLEDSEAMILVTDHEIGWDFPGETVNLETVDLVQAPPFASCIQPDNLMYVIYTSGSTGNPKGVMVEHKSVVRLVKNTNYIQFTTSDHVLQGCSVQFDVSIFEIWGALLNGSVLHLVEKDLLIEVDMLRDYLIKNDITILWMTTPLFNHVADQDPSIFTQLHYLLVGGDTLSPKHIERVRKQCRDVKIINGYGPTENTTFSTCFHIEQEYTKTIPIGTPISNSTAYIMDESLTILPQGVVGELCVGGAGVSRGYINNEALTAEKFIPDLPGGIGRIYRTGDLARMMEDGQIEFLGRKDKQVKIRGYRIELGEIERELKGHPHVAEAVVIVREDENGKSMVAYYSSKTDTPVAGMRQYLINLLPHHMIPSHIIKLAEMPLNNSGKIDTKKLPTPQEIIPGTTPHENTNPIEQNLLTLIEQELLVKNISPEDHLYDLGMDSLIAMKLVQKARKKWNVDVKIRDLMECSTIRELGEKIRHLEGSDIDLPFIQSSQDAQFSLSSPQRRMFLAHQSKGDLTYTVPFEVVFAERIDVPRLQSAFNKLVARHEILRTSFHYYDGMLRQHVHSSVQKTISHHTLQVMDDNVIREHLKTFDLEEPSLIEAEVLTIRDQDRLLVSAHHIIFDGLSTRIFIDELLTLYKGETLTPPALQYREFCDWHNKSQTTPGYQGARQYWLDRFSILPTPLRLPYQPEEGLSDNGLNYVDGQVDQEIIQSAKVFLNEQRISLYTFFMTALTVLVADYSKEKDIVIASVSDGRQREDFQNVIGMFVDTYLLRCEVKNGSFLELLSEVKEALMDAYEHPYQYDELLQDIAGRSGRTINELTRLFPILMVMDTRVVTEHEEVEEIHTMLSTGTSKFGVTLTGIESTSGYTFRLEYDPNLFNRAVMEQWMNDYLLLVSTFARDPHSTILQHQSLLPDSLPVTHYQEDNKRSMGTASKEEIDVEAAAVMIQVWEEVLNVHTIRMTDRFFELGGDSIKAIHIVAKLQKSGIRLKVNTLLIHQTIEEMIPFIELRHAAVKEGRIEGNMVLTPIQRWFFNKETFNKNHYNQSVLLRCRNRLKGDEVTQLFTKLVEHHDVLRSSFRKVHDGYTAFNRGMGASGFDIVTFFAADDEELAEVIEYAGHDLQKDIDMEEGNLVKIGVIHSKEESHLLIIIHHLVIDEVSWHILMDDLSIGYEQLQAGLAIHFGHKTDSYRSFGAELENYTLRGGFDSEIDYWKGIAGKATSDRNDFTYGNKTELTLVLTEEETDLLIHEANMLYRTRIQDLLITSLLMAWQEQSDQEWIVVDLESHGRESIHDQMDLTRTIGWFTSIYPVALSTGDAGDIRRMIIHVKEQLLGVPRNGIGYGALKYIVQDPGVLHARPGICFNYLGIAQEGAGDATFTLSDLNRGSEIGDSFSSHYELEVNCQVRKGKLEFVFTFNKELMEEEAAASIVEAYDRSITRILSHCLQGSDPELTPSDFTSKSVDLDFMDEIFQALEKE